MKKNVSKSYLMSFGHPYKDSKIQRFKDFIKFHPYNTDRGVRMISIVTKYIQK